MQAHRERFGDRGFRQRQLVGDRNGLRRIDRDEFAKAALHMGKAHRAAEEAHVEALVAHAFLAMRHRAHGFLGLTATPGPGFTFVTPSPMAATTPAISCPSAIGCWMRTTPKPP